MTGILTVWSFTKLVDDANNSMSHEKTQAKVRWLAGVLGLAGSMSDITALALEQIGETPLKNMMGRLLTQAPRALQIFGRYAAVAFGLIIGVMDIAKAWDQYKEGNYGLAFGYFASGLIGGGTAIAVFFTAGSFFGIFALGPWFWAAMAALLVITIIIDIFKDDNLQEWFWRCHFGTADKDDKYPDTKTHVEQYKFVLVE